jgi:hydrogenase 3 maturation protease
MNLGRELEEALQGRVVVVGVGNALRGDDGAGCLVARRLAGTPGLTVIEAEEVPESHVGPIARERPDTVLMVDAVHLDAPPGAVALVRRHDLTGKVTNTHRLPLALVMEYLERETGAATFLLAIQPRELSFAGPMSNEVLEAAGRVVELLRQHAGRYEGRDRTCREAPA